MALQRLKTRSSYADLLALYLHQPDGLQTIAKQLGFEAEKYNNDSSKKRESDNDKKRENQGANNAQEQNRDTQSRTQTSPKDRPNIPFCYIEKRERSDEHLNPEPPKQPEWLQSCEPLEGDEIYDTRASYPLWQDLTRSPKLWAKLRQILSQNYITKEPDIPQLIQQIEQGSSLKQFPFLQRKRRVSQLLVLADYAKHLRTSRRDYRRLRAQLERHWGKSNIIWQRIKDYPMGMVSYQKNNHIKEQQWRVPAKQTAVLILSDCGRASDSDTRTLWQRLLQQLKKSGNTVLLLAPSSVKSLQTINLKGIHSYSWDRQLSLAGGVYQTKIQTYKEKQKESHKKQPVESKPQKINRDVEAILSCLAFTYQIEPPLLRAVRQQLNLSVDTEADCRQYFDTDDDTYCLYIKTSALDKYRKCFQQLSVAEQDHWIALVTAHHAPLSRSVLDFELTTAQALRPEHNVKGAKESQQYLQRLAKTFQYKQTNSVLRSWVFTHLEEQEQGGEIPAALFSSYHKAALEAGDMHALILPRKVSSNDIRPFIDMAQTTTECQLVQQENKLHLQAISTKNSATGFLREDSQESEKNFVLACTQQSQRFLSIISNAEERLHDGKVIKIPASSNSITLNTGTENLTINTLTKPDWADNIGRDKTGLFIECQHLGQYLRVYYPEWGGQLEKDTIGLYTELNIKGVIQRFRYIPAGDFIMGSPENEVNRGSDEIQHEVTLSQGYWLADTACTQALWQVLMGDNPASFTTDGQNPVEKVSWNDVQAFLKKLNQLIPQLTAQLPTEAQWEYACRAGTASAFSFGDNITPEQVNYNG
ncbi:MAG TPA: formylglycine-generating enzyme family protein, partial [Leucothrix mucor]|nr:formylglycine-generating enzyme family protein [Leucothrix mucor]